MKTLTLIPSANTYGVMVLVLLIIGSFDLSRLFHIRYFKQKLSFVGSNAVMKSSIAIYGSLIVPFCDILPFNLYQEISGAIIGFLLGLLTIYLEMKLLRYFNRRKLADKKYIHQRNDILRTASIKSVMSLSSSNPITNHGLCNVRQGYNQYILDPDFTRYGIIASIFAGIAEEILFRGDLIYVINAINNKYLICIFLMCAIFLFAFSHASTSWHEFLYKLPLSILTTVSFVITGTVLSPVVIHLILNVYAYFKRETVSSIKPLSNFTSLGVIQ